MTTILIFSACISIAYAIMIVRFIKGWNSIPEFRCGSLDQRFYVSVIVAFRNEEKNLPALFDALRRQSYPSNELEFIFADDHSDDGSVSLVEVFVSSVANAGLIRLRDDEEGKKKSLIRAAQRARGKLLVFTDADCLPGPDWIKTIAAYYLETGSILIASPVVINPENSFFSRFQSLEFFSLMGSTAGSFGIHDPIMVNGANLAADRDVYLQSIDSILNQTASGDDVFLMLHLKKASPGKLSFLKSREASVFCSPVSGFYSFIMQRMRWTSKSRHYRDLSIVRTAILVLLLNFWLLNCFVLSFFQDQFIYVGAGVFLIKSILDFVFIGKILKFFGRSELLRIFVLSQFLYFLYISFVGLAGNIFPSKWKGRRVNL